MTFDKAIATDYGTALADLRDKVGAMTNWSVKDDSTGGATSLSTNDYIVFTTALGEEIRLHVGGGNDTRGIVTEQGDTWDATNDVWDSRYPNDYLATAPTDGSGNPISLAPYAHDNTDSFSMTDSVTYWLAYKDGVGFAFYCTRTVGDGHDGDLFIGLSELTKLWNYNNATSAESEYVHALAGAGYDSYNNRWEYKERYLSFLPIQGVRESPESRPSYGLPNPDGNFSDFPMVEDNIVASKLYENGAGNDAPIGTHTLWMDAKGGSHQDTVQDANANNIYTILKDGGNCDIAIRNI